MSESTKNGIIIPPGYVCGYIGEDIDDVHCETMQPSNRAVMVFNDNGGSVIKFNPSEWLAPQVLAGPWRPGSDFTHIITTIFLGLAFERDWCPGTPWRIFNDDGGLIAECDQDS